MSLKQILHPSVFYTSTADPLTLRITNNETFYMNGSKLNVSCSSGHPFPALETKWTNLQGETVGSGGILNIIALRGIPLIYVCLFKNIPSSKATQFMLLVYCKFNLLWMKQLFFIVNLE